MHSFHNKIEKKNGITAFDNISTRIEHRKRTKLE